MGIKSQNGLSENKTAGAIEDYELDYWSEEFGISKDELIAAVRAGIPASEAVEKYVKEVEFSA
jgi:hypothetical protein